MPTIQRVARSASVLLPLLFSSCFTMALWGVESEEEEDPMTGCGETAYAYDSHTEWSWELFGLRLLLTPVTLCLDALTSPVQCACCGDHHH
jgi:hypothetical protein